jgi:hypothetical protein
MDDLIINHIKIERIRVECKKYLYTDEVDDEISRKSQCDSTDNR